MAASTAMDPLRLTVELDREEDGRWIAEIPEIAGVIAYASSEEAAIASAKGLALTLVGERLSVANIP